MQIRMFIFDRTGPFPVSKESFVCYSFNFCVFSLTLTVASSDGKEVSQLYLNLLHGYKERFMLKNGLIAMFSNVEGHAKKIPN